VANDDAEGNESKDERAASMAAGLEVLLVQLTRIADALEQVTQSLDSLAKTAETQLTLEHADSDEPEPEHSLEPESVLLAGLESLR
jgi:hypothetical protein